MNEGRNKREWIKNVAIVFLIILLLLTFFSNTIMNYSLPEVAVQYVESGSITAKIRGNGVIESGDPYYVTIEQQRKVESVNVRPGDIVQEGDVLAVLSKGQSSDMEAKEQEVEAAKDALEAAQNNFETMLLTGGYDVSVMNSAGEMASADSLVKQIVKLKNQETILSNEISNVEEDIADVDEKIAALELQMSINSISNVGTDEERRAYNDASTALNDANATLERVRIQKENYEILHSISDGDAEYEHLVNSYNAMQTQVNWLTFNKNETERVLTEKLDASNNNLNNQKNSWTVQKNELQKSLDEKNEKLAEVSEDLTELTKNIGDSAALQTASDAITKAQETYQDLLAAYEEMQGVAIDTEVVAPFTGTIVSVPISAGTDTIDSPGEGKGYTIVTMQREGRGYTMEFAVTNDQAKRIAVGDEAEIVNSWRYDNMTLTVSGIKNDLQNPGQGKIVTLDVRGDYITPGQNISVSVGEKSANYDMIVPNSAIREDNNGKFVLLVETKSSPLGNRYIATRADVKVVASDDTKSAITGDLYAWSYVITTATAPVEAGQQVRLAEN